MCSDGWDVGTDTCEFGSFARVFAPEASQVKGAQIKPGATRKSPRQETQSGGKAGHEGVSRLPGKGDG